MDNLHVDLSLVNGKVQFKALSETNPARPLMMDFSPPIGDGEGYAGLELLLVSFCGCVSTAIVALLRRMGKQIDAYRLAAEGIRQENPLMMKKIGFEVIVHSPDIRAEDMEKIMEIAETISPVWLAIKGNVEILGVYRIVGGPEVHVEMERVPL